MKESKLALVTALAFIVLSACVEDRPPGLGGDEACQGEWVETQFLYGFFVQHISQTYYFELSWPEVVTEDGEWEPVDADRLEYQVDAGDGIYTIKTKSGEVIAETETWEEMTREDWDDWARVVAERDGETEFKVEVLTPNQDFTVSYRICE